MHRHTLHSMMEVPFTFPEAPHGSIINPCLREGEEGLGSKRNIYKSQYVCRAQALCALPRAG